MSERVPAKDWPSPGWIEKVAVQLVTILANTAEVDVEMKRDRSDEVRSSLGDFLRHPIEDLVGTIRDGDPLRPGGELKQVVEGIKSQGIGYAFNRLVTKILVGGSKGRAGSVAEFSKLFKTIPRKTIEDTCATDESFARMRVQGPSPVMLRAVAALDDRSPVTDEIYQAAMGPGDSLAAAGAEGRLYLCDHARTAGSM